MSTKFLNFESQQPTFRMCGVRTVSAASPGPAGPDDCAEMLTGVPQQHMWGNGARDDFGLRLFDGKAQHGSHGLSACTKLSGCALRLYVGPEEYTPIEI